MNPQLSIDFDGATYSPKLDKERLKGQMGRVYQIMKNGDWWSLQQIQVESEFRFNAHDSEAAISARLRDFRKDKFKMIYPVRGMESRRFEGGLWKYRLI